MTSLRYLLLAIVCLSLPACEWVKQEGRGQTSIHSIPDSGWSAGDVVQLQYVAYPRTRLYEVELLCRLDTRASASSLSVELSWRRGLLPIATDTLTLDVRQALKGDRARGHAAEGTALSEGTDIIRGVYHTDINQLSPHPVELSPAGLYTLELRLLSPQVGAGVVALGARISPK